MNFYYFFIYLCDKYSNMKPSPLAKKLNISKSTISNWKTRNTFPRDSTIAPIADYFGFSVEELKEAYEKFVQTQKRPAPLEGDGLSPARREMLKELDGMTEEEIFHLLDVIRAVKGK